MRGFNAVTARLEKAFSEPDWELVPGRKRINFFLEIILQHGVRDYVFFSRYTTFMSGTYHIFFIMEKTNTIAMERKLLSRLA